MPLKSESVEACVSIPPRTRSSRSTRFSTPKVDSKAKAQSWRTRGKVDKQSTLTQIDFVRRGGWEKSEDVNLDYEDDTTIFESAPFAKRRKIEVKSDQDGLPAPQALQTPKKLKQDIQQDKENDIFAIPSDENVFSKHFTTPRKARRQEVPSSQSPETPFSTKSIRYGRAALNISPLKAISTNVRRQPRLIVEDTFKTNEQLSSSPVQNRQAVQQYPRASSKGARSPPQASRWLRRSKPGSVVQDSDEDSSNEEMTGSPSSEEFPDTFDDTNATQSGMPASTNDHHVPIQNMTASEAEIMKPPASDSTNGESQNHLPAVVAAVSDSRPPDTLEEPASVVLKRTYSKKRKISFSAEIPSSSSLEELPALDSQLQTNPTSEDPVLDIPSSPPCLKASTHTKMGTQTSEARNETQYVPSSCPPPPQPSDSQQAVAQLQQESQWPVPVVASSQASTASISSFPHQEELLKMHRASRLPRRSGWFFNPLTDSQLLPDSIMNFEIPALPGLLGLRSEDNELEEEQ